MALCRKISVMGAVEAVQEYIIRRRAMRNRWGQVDYGKREITLHSKLRGHQLVATLIHELCHAACPDLSEDAIERLEASVMAGIKPYLKEESEIDEM